jgi:uncharacterized repeat protein (TIGR01451 family)
MLRVAAFLLLAFAAQTGWAEDCSQYPNGVIDGATGTPAPDQIQIDRNCTIRNYPASNPLSTNFSFLTQPGQTDERWVVIFDNVVHTGQMACNAVAGHRIWFTNGSSTSIQEGCQNLLIPVEKIDKQNPPGTTTATVGVPFTYTLTSPVLFDPGTGTVINSSGSQNDLHSVVLTDDLNATGVDLSYVSHSAYWRDSGLPVAHTFSDSGGLLTFDNLPIIPAGDQIIMELTVVLEDTLVNAPGTQFVNTAKWEFGRLIEGVFYQPLPGEWGISPPLTITAPDLVMEKTGPVALNLLEDGVFTLDVRNDGTGEAWDASIIDQLPDSVDGGMCDLTPTVLDARVYAADGSSTVPGKGPLVEGTDYAVTWAGAPACELTFVLSGPAAAVGVGERLIINYQARLDDDSRTGIALTNVAGAVEWFGSSDSNPDRQTFSRTLTDGTPGTVDHQDAHTVNAALIGLFFEKTVANLTSGASPAVTAAPGDRLRYTLRLRTTGSALADAQVRDDLGALNNLPAFQPGSLDLVSIPPGADGGNTDPNGGTNGAGLLDVRGLDVPADGELEFQFDITLADPLIDGLVVLNQAELIEAGSKVADSDDPNVNGPSDPVIQGDEDPTRVLIEAEPPQPLLKENTQDTAAIGELFSYRITVPSTPHSAPLYDVRIFDDLGASAADLEFVRVERIGGTGGWTPVNTGTSTNLVIEDPGAGIDIPLGGQAVVEVTVRLLDTPNNVPGLTFINTASWTYNQLDANTAEERPGLPGSTPPMTIVAPDLTMEKDGPAQMLIGVPGAYSLDIHNVGGATAYTATITDLIPDTPQGGLCDTPPGQVTARLFEADGSTPVGVALVEGTDFAVSFDGVPDCRLRLSMLSTAAAIGPDQRLIITYQALLDDDSQEEVGFTNVAGATQWYSGDPSVPDALVHGDTRALTDGAVGTLDHEDAHTTILFAGRLMYEKTVVNVTTGEDPALVASPGDILRYRLALENVGDVPVSDFAVVDEIDRLNASPAFDAGALNLVTFPAGADVSRTDPVGGASGTGLLEVAGLDLDPGENLVIEFETRLAPVLANGSFVTNQSLLLKDGVTVAQSDDPTVNGQADPGVPDDEDPTRVQIRSAPRFDVYKISTYLDGDPAVLLAGERLRYTITVRNVGDDHAIDARLIDALPVNTSYVAGSTTLNGTPIADGREGTLPLADGIDLSAPEDPTTGSLRADPLASRPDSVATIEFVVTVDPDVIDGTVIANQAFVSALAGGVVEQPSDDPRTDVVDDPTRDVVGNLPLLFAEKSATLQFDGSSPGVVDPLDTLRYTIRVHNNGMTPATLARLIDSPPNDTIYVPGSLMLNGEPVGPPDGGVFPLGAGLPISTADLTPPQPAPDAGVLSAGATATIQFDVQVNAGTPAGTLITNQATVTTAEVGALLTDGDGDPATGPEPTVVVVGDGQQLTITKQVTVVGGGAAVAGAMLEYVVTVRNIAAVPATDVYLTDDLDADTPGHLIYQDQSATLDGSMAGISFTGSVLTADYSGLYGPLPPDGILVLRFRAQINPDLDVGVPVTNTAVVAWNTPEQTARASATVYVGGVPGVGTLSGAAWHDADFDKVPGVDERLLQGWTVELHLNGSPLHTVLTDADGRYRIAGLEPNYGDSYETGNVYDLRFIAPGAGSTTASLGNADSPFTDGPQSIDDILIEPGTNLRDLNLPITPNGVVYDSIVRNPIAGVTVTLLDGSGNSPIAASCFDDPVQQGQATPANGYYKFDLNFSDPSCLSGANYVIGVSPAGGGYEDGYSQIIPPASDSTTAPLFVPGCPGSADDAVPATPDYCEAQPSEFAPPGSVQPRSAGTIYYVNLELDSSQVPGSSQLFNNHIAVDPILDGAVSITKTTPLVNVSRGQLVPFTITINNEFAADLGDLSIVDRFPPGFRYIEGSATIDGESSEPVLADGVLVWSDLGVGFSGRRELKMLMAVGAGVGEGEHINRAQVVNTFTGVALSGEATATVRVVPDPTFDCTDVTGKVFDDANRNGVQDRGEGGLQGVRLVTTGGLAATTDQHGRFHITCAVVPNETRGSNFVLKLDDRTLPSGYRMSTKPVQILRATRGKSLRFNYGASIHRVVGLDMADAVFVPGSTEMRPQWKPRIGSLLAELKKAPSTLRISYVGDVEDPDLVDRRLKAVKKHIADLWNEMDCCYRLTIEPEVFWRLGEPVPRSYIGRREGQ